MLIASPQNLEQFAVMGDIYFRSMFGTNGPPSARRIALHRRGRKQGQRADPRVLPAAEAAAAEFVGNVEGRDLYNGKVDVIVADGFVGNVALKISEGVANLVRASSEGNSEGTITRQVGDLLSRSAFADFKKRLDHTEYGGAPLLGREAACASSRTARRTRTPSRMRCALPQNSPKARNINDSIERDWRR